MAGATRIGVLTGGGDAPGLNAVIRAVVKAACNAGMEVIGLEDSFDGLLDPSRTRRLTPDDVTGILRLGGTILGTTNRGNPFEYPVEASGRTDYSERVVETFHKMGMDALVVIGGDGTLRTALQLAAEGVPLVGVPKTIDNDITATDVTFGFDTAVQIATEAIDRITTTAESHDRVMLVEVMGRTRGWIATYAGIASGADAILVPEEPYDLEAVADVVRRRADQGRRYSVVVVAEGIDPPPGSAVSVSVDAFGFERLGGVSTLVAARLEELTGFEARVTVLGHLQRGGTPTAADRVLGSRLGVAAADLAARGGFGRMVALRGTAVVDVTLDEACAGVRPVPGDILTVARTLTAP